MVGILLEDLDLAVSDGHIALGDNRMDVIENIIDSNEGEWKANKFLGVGIKKMIAQSGGGSEIRQKVVENLNRENIKVENIQVDNENIDIEI